MPLTHALQQRQSLPDAILAASLLAFIATAEYKQAVQSNRRFVVATYLVDGDIRHCVRYEGETDERV